MIKGKPISKVSPIKDSEKPLANPGDSTARELEVMTNDQFTKYYFLAIFPIAFAVMEWLSHWTFAGNQRWTFTALAAIASCFSAYKIYELVKKAKNYIQGLEAEKNVGQRLEELRSTGAQVFHDIPADGFNIDHVVISQTGIYAVETKSLSKIPNDQSKLLFNGENITLNGQPLDRDPVAKAKACSATIKELLNTSIGKNYPVKPVVLFPGWYVMPAGKGNKGEAWVLNPKAFPNLLENAQQYWRTMKYICCPCTFQCIFEKN